MALKVKAVEGIFKALDRDIRKFQEQSGLQCASNCGECCKKPDIEATVLEFLPLAYHLHKSGRTDAILDKLESNPDDAICVLFNPFGLGGNCSEYAYRGLVCRGFGYSAGVDKYGQKVLYTCKIIKLLDHELYEQAVADIREGQFIPVLRDYYYRLYAIDFQLTQKHYPINQCIRLAIETIYFYYAYRGKKAS